MRIEPTAGLPSAAACREKQKQRWCFFLLTDYSNTLHYSFQQKHWSLYQIFHHTIITKRSIIINYFAKRQPGEPHEQKMLKRWTMSSGGVNWGVLDQTLLAPLQHRLNVGRYWRPFVVLSCFQTRDLFSRTKASLSLYTHIQGGGVRSPHIITPGACFFIVPLRKSWLLMGLCVCVCVCVPVCRLVKDCCGCR